MPLYFAYGANLDATAMRGRCPKAQSLGPARLMNFRFFIMTDGVASVRPWTGDVVHGLLWNLAPSDVRPLDIFEDLDDGRYGKIVRPVMKAVGSAQAFLYIGHTLDEGLPLPGYLEAVTAAASAVGLPAAYVTSLQAWGRRGTRGVAFDNHASDAPAGPVPGVRARYRTPHDLT